MFTLCFTSVAAAALKSSRKSSKNARRADAVVRSARIGLVSVVVVLAAGMVQAGGHGAMGGGSLGSMSMSRGNSNSPTLSNQFNSQKLQLTNSSNFQNQSFSVDSKSHLNPVNAINQVKPINKVDTKIGGLNNLGTAKN